VVAVDVGEESGVGGISRLSTSGWPDLYHNLAQGAPLADVGQRLGHLFEAKGAVDVDTDVPRYAEVGDGLEVGRARFDDEQPNPAPGEPTEDRSCGDHPE
jgi:hypothetical protein